MTFRTRKRAQQALPIPVPHPDGNGIMPQWLVDALDQKNPPRNPRTAVWTRCRNCDEIILVGLDADILAQDATVDPTPLDAAQELICALTGRPTYTAQVRGQSVEIWYRQISIERPPNAAGTWPVVPTHKCGARFPGFLIPPEPERNTNREPPF